MLDRDLYVLLQRHADVPVSLELCVVCCSDSVITAMEIVQQCHLGRTWTSTADTIIIDLWPNQELVANCNAKGIIHHDSSAVI